MIELPTVGCGGCGLRPVPATPCGFAATPASPAPVVQPCYMDVWGRTAAQWPQPVLPLAWPMEIDTISGPLPQALWQGLWRSVMPSGLPAMAFGPGQTMPASFAGVQPVASWGTPGMTGPTAALSAIRAYSGIAPATTRLVGPAGPGGGIQPAGLVRRPVVPAPQGRRRPGAAQAPRGRRRPAAAPVRRPVAIPRRLPAPVRPGNRPVVPVQPVVPGVRPVQPWIPAGLNLPAAAVGPLGPVAMNVGGCGCRLDEQ